VVSDYQPIQRPARDVVIGETQHRSLFDPEDTRSAERALRDA